MIITEEKVNTRYQKEFDVVKSNTDKLYAGLFAVSLTGLMSLLATLNFIGYDPRNLFTLKDDIYYVQTPIHVVFNLCCILLALSLVHFIMNAVHLPGLGRVFSNLSANLNNIFIVQWMIIGWLSYVIIPNSAIPLVYIFPTAILIMIVSCIVVFLYQKASRRKNIL